MFPPDEDPVVMAKKAAAAATAAALKSYFLIQMKLKLQEMVKLLKKLILNLKESKNKWFQPLIKKLNFKIWSKLKKQPDKENKKKKEKLKKKN